MTQITPICRYSGIATSGRTLNTPKHPRWSLALSGIHSTRICLPCQWVRMNMNRRILAMYMCTHWKTTSTPSRKSLRIQVSCVWTSMSMNPRWCASGVTMVQSWSKTSGINSANHSTVRQWKVANTMTQSGKYVGILRKMLKTSKQCPVMVNCVHGV